VAGHGRTGSIVLERVTQRFPVPREDREFTAVQDVSIDVRGGEFISIVGPSGCGKSTLLSLIAGLVPVTSGRITIDGQGVSGVNTRLGFVFQRDAIFPWKTVAQNVGLPLLFRGVDAASARPRVAEWIGRIGLTGFEQYHPYQLSGGMRKRVALAMTMVYEPEIVLMDEPFGALDAQTRETLQDELSRIQRVEPKTILFVTHSIREAVYLADRVVVMTSVPGRIRQIFPIKLPEVRDRFAAEFTQYESDITRVVKEEVAKVHE
jgi:NitT/TauT family transport system ATP-binding protein